MKHIFLLLLTLFLGGCSKDDDQTINPVDQLPSATQIGANKVGCLLNGEVFLPKGSNPLGPPIMTCHYQFVDNGYEFGLGFTNNSHGIRGITILTNKLEFVQGQTYVIKQEEIENSVYAYFNNGLIYFGSNSIKTGQLTITKLDQVNNIISGTFWFDAENSNGMVVQVREGRFDMQYSP
jgi:hypothetical protein